MVVPAAGSLADSSAIGRTAVRPTGDKPVHLLDGNVLVALVSATHVHHPVARDWFTRSDCPFASCPITQGTLLRLLMQLNQLRSEEALDVLARFTAHPRHRFWADNLSYADVSWRGVLGHRQVTDAYLAGLARHHHGKLLTLDRGLAALHSDVAVGLGESAGEVQ
jgi:uncharacterized protein